MEKVIIVLLILVILGLLGYIIYSLIKPKPQPTQVIIQPTNPDWFGYEPRYPGYWGPDVPRHHNPQPKPSPKLLPKPLSVEGFASCNSWKEF